MANAAFTLTQPLPLHIAVIDSMYNGSGLKCSGDSAGYIHLVVTGGVPVYIYTWLPGVSADSIADSLKAGAYTYTVTDANLCVDTGSATLKPPPALSLPYVTSNFHGVQIKCNGDSTSGWITVTPAGGTPSFIYSWSPNTVAGQGTDSIYNLPAGTYSVIVTDTNGCTAMDTVTLNENKAISDLKDTSNYNGAGIKCSGDSASGWIAINVAGGTGTYTYLWTPDNVAGQGTDSIYSLWAATWSVTIADSNGCILMDSVTLNEPAPIVLVLDSSSYGTYALRCHGDSSGWIHLKVSGGTPSYTYQWSDSAGALVNDTLPVLDSISAGKYVVLITDTNGCMILDSATLTAKPVIIVNAGELQQICADATALSGTVPLQGDTGTWTVLMGEGKFSDANDPDATVTGLSRPDTSMTQPADTNIVLWTITYAGYDCGSSTDTIITFQAAIAVAGPDDSICPNLIPNGVLIIADSAKAGIAWWRSLGSASVLDSLNHVTEVKNPVKGDNLFVWTVINGPCPAVDTLNVFIKDSEQPECVEDLVMPTGFTPNGDGYNDFFDIHGILKYPYNTLTIYNRWGNEVFSMDDYNNAPGHRWEGQNKSSDPLPAGTYYAILVIKSPSPGHAALHGYVDLRR